MEESITVLRRLIDRKYARREDKRDWTAIKIIRINNRKLGQRLSNQKTVKVIKGI